VGFVSEEGADCLYVRFKTFASLVRAFSLSCGPFRTVTSHPSQLTATIPRLKVEIMVSTPGIPSRCVDSQRCPSTHLGGFHDEIRNCQVTPLYGEWYSTTKPTQVT
jgi:hypothetical protein